VPRRACSFTLRRLLSLRSEAAATAGTAAGTGTSGRHAACCAHHLTDALPVLGLSGLAVFLGDYRVPLMAAGIAVNVAGVLFMLWLVLRERRDCWRRTHVPRRSVIGVLLATIGSSAAQETVKARRAAMTSDSPGKPVPQYRHPGPLAGQ
jgi:hypothetical protein